LPTFFIIIIIIIIVSTGFVELGNIRSSLPPPGKTPNPYRCIRKVAKGLNKQERASLGGNHFKPVL